MDNVGSFHHESVLVEFPRLVTINEENKETLIDQSSLPLDRYRPLRLLNCSEGSKRSGQKNERRDHIFLLVPHSADIRTVSVRHMYSHLL